MSSVDETRATPMRCRAAGCVGIARECTIRHRMAAWRPAVFRRAFVAATIGWAVALLLATFIASRPYLSSAPYLFAVTVYLAGRTICHQIAERSFQPWGHQMPVCARCTGIYVGGALAAIVAPFRLSFMNRAATNSRHHKNKTGSFISRCRVFVANRVGEATASDALVAAALPTAITLVFEWTTGITPSNAIRSLAGLPIGAVIAWLVVRVLR